MIFAESSDCSDHSQQLVIAAAICNQASHLLVDLDLTSMSSLTSVNLLSYLILLEMIVLYQLSNRKQLLVSGIFR